eukprot:3990592-Pleurochrysis_carterae.AAC.3
MFVGGNTGYMQRERLPLGLRWVAQWGFVVVIMLSPGALWFNALIDLYSDCVVLPHMRAAKGVVWCDVSVAEPVNSSIGRDLCSALAYGQRG